ncbi:MAG: SDR family oxidoreductase [Eubacteriales bacterium]|nr:SDR family oxidoreductase [Eubacteriales bacterium]
MIIVITGTHKGIGKRMAEYYLKNGHTVIGCSRHESTIELEGYTHFVVDICEDEQVVKFASAVRKQFGKIDALINNAGIASMNHFLMTPIETSMKLMDVNYFGGLRCIRAFINLLKKSEHPRIINFSTVAVPFNLDGEMSYASSKSAVESMTKILAKELATFSVTVNAVGPTPIQTDLIAKVPQEKLQRLLDNQAIHRFGQFEDVINVIDFYLNERSDFITGQIVYLGGVNH